jgi:hypothetical protein
MNHGQEATVVFELMVPVSPSPAGVTSAHLTLTLALHASAQSIRLISSWYLR